MKTKVTKEATEKLLVRREALAKAGKYVAFTSLAMITMLTPQKAAAQSEPSQLGRPSSPRG